jgi:hypothetical protein
MSAGLRQSPFIILTEHDIRELKKDIHAIQADVNIFEFNEGWKTSYYDFDDKVRVKGDVYPIPNSIHPRDLMSARAVLAHEYYGHRPYRNVKLKLIPGSWNDEFRASYMAAKNAPGLSHEDRKYLVLDALERAKSSGIVIKYNAFIMEVLYGY